MEFTKDCITHVEEVSRKIADIVAKTPLISSNWLSKETGCSVYLKMESEQITNSFKLRGAANKITKLVSFSNTSFDKPIVTASSGNHALACSVVSSQYNIKMVIFMRKSVAKVKEEALGLYSNVRLIKTGDDCCEAELAARRYANEHGLEYISPYNDMDVIYGQATIGLELLSQLPTIDAVFVPVGGGGLASGIIIYLKHKNPDIKVIGCQPVNDCCMYESIRAGKIVEDNVMKPTFADGVGGRVEPGSVTFEICQQYIDDWVLLTEDEIEIATYDVLVNQKKLIEGSAGLTVAALRKVKSQYQNKNVALIMSGGNIGVDYVKILLDKHMLSSPLSTKC